MAEKMIGKSYLNFQQDAAVPHSYPWHPRLSERLGLFRLIEGQGNHEVCFTNPKLLGEKIIEAGRDLLPTFLVKLLPFTGSSPLKY